MLADGLQHRLDRALENFVDHCGGYQNNPEYEQRDENVDSCITCLSPAAEYTLGGPPPAEAPTCVWRRATHRGSRCTAPKDPLGSNQNPTDRPRRNTRENGIARPSCYRTQNASTFFLAMTLCPMHASFSSQSHDVCAYRIPRRTLKDRGQTCQTGIRRTDH